MQRGTRGRLVDAAADLFYTLGFQAVGLDQILAAVGITKTAFYKHFESKDDLILAVLEQRDREDIAEAIAYMRQHGGSDPLAQILAFFDLLAQWFAQPDFRGCFFMNAATEFPSPRDPIHRAAAAHTEHLATELLLRAQAARLADPQRVTKQLMLLTSGAIAARHAGNVADAALTARLTAEALLAPQGTAPVNAAPTRPRRAPPAQVHRPRPARPHARGAGGRPR